MNNLKNKKSEIGSLDIKKFWDEIYNENSRDNLGWYEPISEQSLSLIKKYSKDRDKIILDAGCGETTLLQSLLDEKFSNVQGVDISSEALKFLESNIKIPKNANLVLRIADLTNDLNFEKKGIIWHDRAVFHFIHDKNLKERYKNNLNKFLDKEGVFILSCFSSENSTDICSGLKVKRYSKEELVNFFKDSFTLVESFIYEYTMPWGDIRKFIYCVFIKKI